MDAHALTPAERRAALTALREWLATYSQGVRPEGYEDAAGAARKLEERGKTLEQAKKKAATEEEAALYTALIAVIQDIAPNLVGE